MYIAITKRRENIAEYILYLWQLEDLLRALQFSPEAVWSQLVKPYGDEPERAQQMLEWYMDIAELMRREGKEQSGHLDHTLHLIGDLQNLHLQLLSLPVGKRYRELFSRLESELPRLRGLLEESKTLDAETMSDMELLFRTLYATMLYRIKGGEKAERNSAEVNELISPVIATLADMYRKVEQGEIDLFENSI